MHVAVFYAAELLCRKCDYLLLMFDSPGHVFAGDNLYCKICAFGHGCTVTEVRYFSIKALIAMSYTKMLQYAFHYSI